MTPFNLALYNHWSYVGIGWSLGIESCIQSIEDSLALADEATPVPVGINMDARAFEIIAGLRPELIARLADYCRTGRAEIVGGSYSQPMGSTIGGESNIRQLEIGREAIRRATGVAVVSFLEEEEFSHPQLPQMLLAAGFTGASLSQCDTWGYCGSPESRHSVVAWEGVDGSRILAATHNRLHLHPPAVTGDVELLYAEAAQRLIREMAEADRLPVLVQVWTEFGWEKLDGMMINQFDRAKYRRLKQELPVVFTTLGQYLEECRQSGVTPPAARHRMDDFAKMLPWGIGGDQLRRHDRRLEQELLALEALDAMAFVLGVPCAIPDLEELWKGLLTAQSHDVSLCEFSRWQGGMPPADAHFPAQYQAWGAIGMNHLFAAETGCREATGRLCSALAGELGGVVVFNPSAWERGGVVRLSGLELPPDAAIRFADGSVTPVQPVADCRQHGSALFEVAGVPGCGWKSGELISHPGLTSPLKADLSGWSLENDHVRVSLRESDGRIVELLDKGSGRNLLDPEEGFGRFHGRAELNAWPPAKRGGQAGPVELDTARTPCRLRAIETGPVRAVISVQWQMPWTTLEMRLSLSASSPAPEVDFQLKSELPPPAEQARPDSWQLEYEPVNGWWIDFKPAFEVTGCRRDYPYGIDASGKASFPALTFADFSGRDCGLQVLHGGNQYFRRHPDGRIGNLVMREWESHFTGHYGWPIYSRFSYRLLCHDGRLSARVLARNSEEFARGLPAGSASPKAGDEGAILTVSGDADAVMLRRDGDELQLRSVEYEHMPGKLEIRDGSGRLLAAQRIRPAGIQSWKVAVPPRPTSSGPGGQMQ